MTRHRAYNLHSSSTYTKTTGNTPKETTEGIEHFTKTVGNGHFQPLNQAIPEPGEGSGGGGSTSPNLRADCPWRIL